MNPLTLVKRIQNINSKEAALGISEDASWHAKYKESAYVFVGGVPFDLTEGDLLAVFAQYGEIVDVNLVRDKGTGKSKGFAFVAYEDQRSTNLAVDNLNGAQILGRIVRVDHVTKYKKKEEEDEEEEQRKREARGVCHAFQKGECNRGATCKFSHDEQRSANTGWGAKNSSSRWGHDKYEAPPKSQRSGDFSDRIPHSTVQERYSRPRSVDKNARISNAREDEGDKNNHSKRSNPREKELDHNEDRYRGVNEEGSRRHRSDPAVKEDRDRKGREDRSSGRHKLGSSPNEDEDFRRGEKRSRYERDTSSYSHREEEGVHSRKSHR